jgi:(S)-mandelate dehydrogenase
MIERALNYEDVRAIARHRLPRGLFEYIDRGTEDEIGLAATRRAWDEVKLTPSALVDVASRSMETELFGKRVSMPLVVAPTALAGLVWHDGEVALARAAESSGIPFTVSTQSVTAIEKIATSGARIWLQLYVWRDRALTYAFMERAERAGAEALLLTVDTAVSPNREYNTRNGFGIPLKPTITSVLDVLAHPRWLAGVLLRQVILSGMPTYAHYPPEFRSAVGREALGDAVKFCERVSWADVAELRRRWRGPLLLKGILSVDDACRAREAGCDGIVVSNHGARNLDCAPTTVEALPSIAEAVGDKMTVLVDSGVRRGSHIARAIALGARGALVGRAPLYGLSVAGEAGARHMLGMLKDELSRTMGLLGCRDLTELKYRAPAYCGSRFSSDNGPVMPSGRSSSQTE